MKRNKQTGFTLIEIAIVLLIVSILLGYTVALFPIQQELKQYRAANQKMDEVIEALVGFAQVNGRLPCPDTSGGGGTIDGQEDTADALPADGVIDSCLAYSGFIPAGAIGINGDFDASRRLLDPWGQPYRYHVSNFNAAALPAIDLVTPNGVREEGISNVVPDLIVCDTSLNATATNTTCSEAGVAGNIVVAGVAVVIVSTGKDVGLVTSNIQDENTDDFHNGANDKVYTLSTRSDVAGAQYDDVVKWISTSIIFSKMIEADQLP